MLYPLLFEPIYKEMVWGGSRLNKQFNRKSPYERTGESWDISCRPKEMGVIENGEFSGMAFDEFISQNPIEALGSRIYKDYEKKGFPLLVKIIDANDDLSVQVHPDDDYALAKGFECGKNEMWYVMDAPEGQSLIIGLKEGTTAEMLRHDPMSRLNYLPVKKGDIINIPAGLVHAITNGVMVAEIQQNSDVTFRIYDYKRKGLDGRERALHLEDGAAVSDFNNLHSKKTVSLHTYTEGDVKISPALKTPYFEVIKYEIDGRYKGRSNPEAFEIFTCTEGSCDICGFELMTSRSVFIPAGLGEYIISGKATLLKSFVPKLKGNCV